MCVFTQGAQDTAVTTSLDPGDQTVMSPTSEDVSMSDGDALIEPKICKYFIITPFDLILSVVQSPSFCLKENVSTSSVVGKTTVTVSEEQIDPEVSIILNIEVQESEVAEHESSRLLPEEVAETPRKKKKKNKKGFETSAADTPSTDTSATETPSDAPLSTNTGKKKKKDKKRPEVEVEGEEEQQQGQEEEEVSQVTSSEKKKKAKKRKRERDEVGEKDEATPAAPPEHKVKKRMNDVSEEQSELVEVLEEEAKVENPVSPTETTEKKKKKKRKRRRESIQEAEEVQSEERPAGGDGDPETKQEAAGREKRLLHLSEGSHEDSA